MFRKFVAPIIENPFTLYVDRGFRNQGKKVLKFCYEEIKFSGMWVEGLGEGCDTTKHYYSGGTHQIEEVTKITYTYYDYLKKRKINQIIYKR